MTIQRAKSRDEFGEREQAGWTDLTVRVLVSLYADLDGAALLAPLIRDEFPGRIAVVSSFGADAAVVLGMVAAIDPTTPVIFLDTRKHFGETLRHRDNLASRLGLTDIRSIQPDPAAVADRDLDGTLWRSDPDACCFLRKVAPLRDALDGFDAWITGRKSFQTAARADLPTIEAADGRIKINPLARWSAKDVQSWLRAKDLPTHPLVADGYPSIGCMPCTDRVSTGEDNRAGRWRGGGKTECGIHQPGSER